MSKKNIILKLLLFLLLISAIIIFTRTKSSENFFTKLSSQPYVSIHYINPEKQYKYRKFSNGGRDWKLSEFSYIPTGKLNNTPSGELVFKLNGLNGKRLVIGEKISFPQQLETVDSFLGGTITSYQEKYQCNYISFMPAKNNKDKAKPYSIVNLYVLSRNEQVDHYILLINFEN